MRSVRTLRLRQLARRFWLARNGNVAITFAIALIPLLAFVGAAVDFSRANALKVQMQGAVDSTALMVAKNAALLSETEIQNQAKSFFLAMFQQPEASNIKFTATYSTAGGSKIAVGASADIETVFMGILGVRYVTVEAESTAKWGSTRLRVALVLDNTGSMADAGKMTALKAATKNLLTQLEAAASVNGDVYVSIVPFAKDVNSGAGNYGASWIDWTEWDAENRICSGWQWGNYCFGTWVTAPRTTWNGCVADRGNATAPSPQNYDQTVVEPQANIAASKYPAEQDAYCPKPIKELSYDWAAMRNLVDQMSPNGATNQPIGLVWGWLSLAGGGPLRAPAKDSNYQYQEVIILLSDGLNTKDRWYGNGSSPSASVDQRMYDSSRGGAGTCANIKAAGIKIYTVQVNTAGDPTSTLLRNCASSSGEFFLLTSASQIITTFNTIGTNLTKLRIAQ